MPAADGADAPREGSNMRTFKHGVHPGGHKGLSKDEPIRAILPAEQVMYPLSQHIGAPAIPLVKAGDRVLVGQPIAEAGSFVSVPIHSAVSGTVKAIAPHMTASGSPMETIVIDNDGQYTSVEGFGVERDWQGMTADEIIEAVRQAGIVGLGGAGFPTHVKLCPKDPAAIRTVIINGVECEPYLTTDYRLMLEKTDDLLIAIDILLRLFPNARAVIGIEDNKPLAIRQLREAAASAERIDVYPLKTKYPQGGERMLIHAVTGTDINSSMLPMEAGCVVENVASVLAIGDAVRFRVPLISRVMTVTGDAVAAACNLKVAIGDSYSHVLEAAGGFKIDPQKIITGGPMTGTAMFDLDVPVVKTSASILALVEDEPAQQKTTACIHCGHCVRACPEFLVPQMLYRAARSNDFDRFEKLHGMECIECGCCTYACPAKLPLGQAFKYAKQEVAKRRRAKKAAEEKKEGDPS